MSRRKNTLPILILTILLWLVLGFIIFFVDPNLIRDLLIPGAYLLFFLILYSATFLTFGFIWATGLVLFLILRLLKIGYWLNLLLIIGVCITLQITFTKKD